MKNKYLIILDLILVVAILSSFSLQSGYYAAKINEVLKMICGVIMIIAIVALIFNDSKREKLKYRIKYAPYVSTKKRLKEANKIDKAKKSGNKLDNGNKAGIK